jgi:hypothetical protein
MIQPRACCNLRTYIAVLAVLMLAVGLGGCKDRYDEGYANGFLEGSAEATTRAELMCTAKVENAKRDCSPAYSPQSYTTEVCGGGGVNVRGKHYPSGKTGCVRVYGDGRVVSY